MANGKKDNSFDSLKMTAQSKAQKEGAAERRNSSGTIVKVELFIKKREINALKERVKAEAVIRKEKVDLIRKMIRNKAYTINSELVVRSILRDHLLDELL